MHGLVAFFKGNKVLCLFLFDCLFLTMLGVLVLKFKKYVIVFFYYAQWYKRLNQTQGTRFVATLALARDQGKGVARLRAYK